MRRMFRGTRRWAAAAVLSCLAIRALIPLGYMPGDVLAGEFFTICPTGLPSAIVEQLHLGHDSHSETVVDADRSCPIGSALKFAWLPAEIVEHSPVVAANGLLVELPEHSWYGIHERRYQSRAPPLI